MSEWVGLCAARTVARKTRGWVTQKTCANHHQAAQIAEDRNVMDSEFEWKSAGRYVLCRVREAT